jgi:hypothetical protein
MSRTLPWVALVIAGCAVDADSTTAIDQAVISPNGTSANGVPASVISPNGVSPSLLKLSGVLPSGLHANGTSIRIADVGTSAPWTGAALVGSTWTGLVSDGAPVALRIDDAVSATDDERWSYRLSASFDGAWRPLCADDAGNPGFAVSVHGTWNLAEGVSGGGAYHAATAAFTIACRGSSIAKCVDLGYTPWTGHSDELAACTRALRGDFCGDGTPYTVNGTLVNLYDQSGVQLDGVGWIAEAEWTADGARCVSKKKAARFSQAAGLKPSCYPHALKPSTSCGDEFDDETTIITELPPQ